MLDMECPKCGRFGSVPNDKVNSRLVCKKCLTIFHLTPTGRAVPGEPPDHKYEGQHAPGAVPAHLQKRDAVDYMADFRDMGRAPVMLGALAVCMIALGAIYFLGGDSRGDVLQIRAKSVADALERDNSDFVKANTTKDSLSDVIKWFDKVHPIIAEMTRESSTKEINDFVFVIEENPVSKIGQVEISYTITRGSARTEEITSEAAAVAKSGRTSLTLPMYWVLDDSGKWLIDGAKTLAASANMH